jgi:hypothetical protein
MNTTLSSQISVEFDATTLAFVDNAMHSSPVAEEALFFQSAKRQQRDNVTAVYLTEAQWNLVIDRLDEDNGTVIGNYIWERI